MRRLQQQTQNHKKFLRHKLMSKRALPRQLPQKNNKKKHQRKKADYGAGC
jgi:hypothetical protein